MKKRYTTLFILLLLSAVTRVDAQSFPPLLPEQDACNAIELCGYTYTAPSSYTGFGAVYENSFSIIPESNSVWFKIKVATAGNIVFTITPLNNVNDYDFSIHNITNATCSTIRQCHRDQIQCKRYITTVLEV